MKTAKKLLAILMAAVLVLGLVACNKAPAGQTGNENNEFEDPRMIGMLVFGCEAAVNVSYDNEGMVLAIEAANTEGEILTEGFADVEGKSCADLVAELIDLASKNAQITENVIIKQSFGSEVPNDTFLDSLATSAKDAVAAVGAVTNVVTISAAQLDENGYIGAESVKTIMLNKLGADSASTFSCESSPDINANFLVYIEAGEVRGSFYVNGITGAVAELTEEDLQMLEGNPGEENIPYEEETDFDNLPTEPPATQATEPTNNQAATEPVDATEATTEATEATTEAV